MALDDFLLEGERVVDSYEELDITNLRVIKHDQVLGEESFKDIHYLFLESVEYGKASRWWLFFLSMALFLFGVLVFVMVKELMYLFVFFVAGILAFILFSMLKKKHMVFEGHNSRIEIGGGSEEIIRLVRELQNKYMSNR